MSENPREPTNIEERLARIEADLAVIKNAVTEHAHWITWLKSMVTQRPESIDSEVP